MLIYAFIVLVPFLVLIVMFRPAFCHVDIEVCVYSTYAFFFYCQVVADVDNVHRRELVNLYGV